MQSEMSNEYFYSNCLIEAIKAKIKKPFSIKIKYIPAHLNEVFCPHWMWQDKKYTYDFHIDGKLKWYQLFLYKGYIRKSEYDYYNRYLEAVYKWNQKKNK